MLGVDDRWSLRFQILSLKLLYNDMSGSSSDHTVFHESFSLATSKLFTVSVWQKCIIHFFYDP